MHYQMYIKGGVGVNMLCKGWVGGSIFGTPPSGASWL